MFLRRTDGSAAVRLGYGNYPAMSPDGKWVAALDLSSPQQIELLPTGIGQQGGEPVPFPVKLGSDDAVIRFERDGKSVLVKGPGVPAKIERMFLDSNRREEVRQIAPSDPADVQDIVSVRFSEDDKSYAYSYMRSLSDLWVVTGLN